MATVKGSYSELTVPSHGGLQTTQYYPTTHRAPSTVYSLKICFIKINPKHATLCMHRNRIYDLFLAIQKPRFRRISILLWTVCFTLSPNRLCFSINFLCHSSDPREALCANAHSTPTKPSWSSLSGRGELRIKTFKISYGTPWEAKARALSTPQAASPSLETVPGLSPEMLMHTNENTPLSRRNKHIYTHALLKLPELWQLPKWKYVHPCSL